MNKNDSKTLDEKLRILEGVLPKILEEGYVIIEDLILETLYSKYGLNSVFEKDKFTDYIIELRKQKEEKDK